MQPWETPRRHTWAELQLDGVETSAERPRRVEDAHTVVRVTGRGARVDAAGAIDLACLEAPADDRMRFLEHLWGLLGRRDYIMEEADRARPTRRPEVILVRS